MESPIRKFRFAREPSFDKKKAMQITLIVLGTLALIMILALAAREMKARKDKKDAAATDDQKKDLIGPSGIRKQ
jgi:flagellar basal body-associated protein FliL